MTRKNANGSRNDDAAALAATVWTVLATAELHGLNTLTYRLPRRLRRPRRQTPT